MKRSLTISAVCSASLFIFLVYARAAVEPAPPAVKTPVPAAAVDPAEKIQGPATSYAETPDGDSIRNSQLNILSPDDAVGHTDFDEFSSVSDPLYREGSKALLQKAMDNDKSPKAPVKKAPVKKSLWRDAPADIPAKAAKPASVKGGDGIKSPVFPLKKNRPMKLIPADPVKNKSIL